MVNGIFRRFELLRKTAHKGIKPVIKFFNALIWPSFEMIKFVKKGNIIFLSTNLFMKIFRKVFQLVIVLIGVLLYHSLAFPPRDKEKIFIHTPSYWSQRHRNKKHSKRCPSDVESIQIFHLKRWEAIL